VLSVCFSCENIALKTFIQIYACDRIRDSVVGIADRGQSSSPGRVKNFLFFKSSRVALGPTQPPIQWAPGALSPGVKRPGPEADQSPPTSAEVKKMWLYISTKSLWCREE
jgi:hypothetical protein